MSRRLQGRLWLGLVFGAGCTVDMPSRGLRAPDAGSGAVDALRGNSDPRRSADGSSDRDARLGVDAATRDASALDATVGRVDGGGGDATPDLGRTDGGFVKPDFRVVSPGDALPSPDLAVDAAPVSPPDACVIPPEGPVAETCNGLDDDCNGAIDDAARCGEFVAAHCRAWLLWADQPMPAVGALWGDCPAAPEDFSPWHDQNVVCNSSQGDGGFHPVPFAGDVDATDMLGVGFTCDPGAGPVAPWVQSHCRMYVGQVDVFRADLLPDDTESWGGCPAANEGVDALARCVGSGGDGLFHAMSLVGDVNRDDRFAIAFRCEAPPDEGPVGAQRAAMHTATVRLFLGFSTDGWVRPPYEGWGDCPDRDRDDEGDYRCVSSARDGRFHAVSLDAWWDTDVDGDDMFSVALRGADE